MTSINPDRRRVFLTAEERGRRFRQQTLGRRLGQTFDGLELQTVPDDFMELLRLADVRAGKRST